MTNPSEEDTFLYTEALKFLIEEAKDADYMVELGGLYYLFVFDHNGASTEKVKITFGLRFGDMSNSIKNYSVSVSFKDDGSISAVGG